MDGVKFRHQQPVGSFVVDFYTSAFRLVIEVNGPIHDRQREEDRARQQILEELGLAMKRIKTEIVEKSLQATLTLIRDKIQELEQNLSIPFPLVGEG